MSNKELWVPFFNNGYLLGVFDSEALALERILEMWKKQDSINDDMFDEYDGTYMGGDNPSAEYLLFKMTINESIEASLDQGYLPEKEVVTLPETYEEIPIRIRDVKIEYIVT